MAAPLSSRQSSLASQLLQKKIAIYPSPLWERACPRWRRCCLQGRARWQASSYRKTPQPPASPCGSGLARDGSAAVFKAELAGKPAPTEKHRNLPPPPVGAGLPAMASLLSSRQSSPASQLLQKSICPRWQRCCLQGRARWQASSYKKHRNLPPPPCGSGLARDGVAAGFKAELAGKPAPTKKHRNLPPPPCGSGLARDGSAAVFKAELAGKPAPTEKHRNLPPPPCGSGLARDGSAAVFKAELAGKPAPTEKHRNLPPPPVGAGLPATLATNP